MVEDGNRHLEDQLKENVKTLKYLSINIGTEVREQNKFLKEMDEDFDKSSGLLGKTMGRLRGISKSGHWKMWVYIALFAFFVFFVCWVIVRFR